MRAPLAIFAALLATVPTVGALGILPLPIAEDPGEMIVGFHEGALADTLSLVTTLGATVLSQNEDLRILVVSAKSMSLFAATAGLSPLVEFTETNDVVRESGSQWNGAQWNGAQWNGAQWNGAQWNGNTSGDPGRFTQWGLRTVDAAGAWSVSQGDRRASLCVLDSGVAWDHPDLAANIWSAPDGTHGYNAIDPRQRAYDDAGHGTHMAGIAAAGVANGIGISGVGNAAIMSVKVLSADGTGREDDLAAGLAWCATHRASVALMALSVDSEGPTVRRALEFAAERDVLLVASAGNGGSCRDCVAYPASSANVLAVSAIRQDESLASFSSQGPEVDLAAPGVDIVSTFLDGDYRSGSGTSQAAAFVAGAAALVRDHDGSLTAAQARDKLLASARDIGAPGVDAKTGRGALDVAAAME